MGRDQEKKSGRNEKNNVCEKGAEETGIHIVQLRRRKW